MSEDVVIDLRDPRPGTLGYRIRQIEEDHDPEPGTLGDRLCATPSARQHLARMARRQRRRTQPSARIEDTA